MKLLVQEFLETKSFDQLIKDHGVYASLSKNKKKASFNYDMIETKESDILAQDCRGLILCKSDYSEFKILPDGKLNLSQVLGETIILTFGFKRFFNYGQGACAEINWKTAKIANKYDGTLCLISHDPIDHKWQVSTRSSPEADIPLDSSSKYTFRTLFEKALFDTNGQTFYEFTKNLDQNITYCFELETPYNQIVVTQHTCKITFLAARNVRFNYPSYKAGVIGFRYADFYDFINLDEIDISTIDLPGISKAEIYSLSTPEEICNFFSSRSTTEHEGVVVCDDNFNRIKVKNANYIALSKLRDSLATSDRNCLELILHGKDDDAIVALPKDIAENLSSIKEKYKIWLIAQEKLYHEVFSAVGALADKKSFALMVKKYDVQFSAAFYQIFDGKAESVKQFIENNKKSGSWSSGFLDKILSCI